MKAGKEYELLIEKLYRFLEPNAIVTHDDHIYDERAKIKRQIDVSIRYMFAGVEHLIIVQAKDYKIKANVEIVDQFQQVIEDTNANKGILVCSSGFSAAALTKAKSYGIECLSIHSALQKKWETLVKIQVERTIHDFTLQDDLIMNIAHKAGKQVALEDDMYSYDKLNIISMTDIVIDYIIKKHSWKELRKGNNMSVLFKDIKLYHLFDDEMLRVSGGALQTRFIKSRTDRFFIDPENYVYEVNHTRESAKLHDLTISFDSIDMLMGKEFENDKNITGTPIIKAEVFRFNNEVYHMTYSLSMPINISGKLLVKGNIIRKDDERGRHVAEWERKLKGL